MQEHFKVEEDCQKVTATLGNETGVAEAEEEEAEVHLRPEVAEAAAVEEQAVEAEEEDNPSPVTEEATIVDGTVKAPEVREIIVMISQEVGARPPSAPLLQPIRMLVTMTSEAGGIVDLAAEVSPEVEETEEDGKEEAEVTSWGKETETKRKRILKTLMMETTVKIHLQLVKNVKS